MVVVDGDGDGDGDDYKDKDIADNNKEDDKNWKTTKAMTTITKRRRTKIVCL